ncbi:MAG: PIG-L family deacetylase [Cyclobacteriaceae bacterium]|nr:PIG-L family deacetylase [Cyclobacteriaceae bacterium]UYN85177.1 MAG: PIG-L family deacetylase [Cyclobacteriaceae bacterium]
MRSLVFLFFILPTLLFSQPHQPNAAQLKLSLKKLNFLGSALYVAAHPDDENTRVIAWLASERMAATAYLSMTRGDGGQNLIGPEIRDQLGLIRTQELITARKIDGGEQFFTRANDFGYSKSADETLVIWKKDEILSDVVRVYRAFQPDVVITRFPPDERAGHGHHTASAMLAQEAFDLSGLTTAYPDQLTALPVWKPIRVYTNTGRFFSNTIDENTPGVTTLNVGGYNALLGASYAEIAAASRSQHKSQGFGASGRRGDAQEFFELAKGAAATADIFDGVNTSWSRVKGGNAVQPLVERAIREFDAEKPFRSIPLLLQIRKAIDKVEPGVWKERKLREVEQLIKDCSGFFIEVAAATYYASPGQNVLLNYEIINRSPIEVVVQRLSSTDLKFDSAFATPLKNNVPLLFKSRKTIHPDKSYSDPYWLREPHELGRFTVSDKSLIGKPENDPAVMVDVQVAIEGEKLVFTVPVVYKWTDPVKGELYRPFEIVPPVFVNLTDPVLIFKDNSPRQVNVVVKSSTDLIKGDLSLQLPEGWRSEPSSVSVSLSKQGEESTQSFTIYPASREMIGTVRAVMTIGNKDYDYALQTIQYDHIPVQTLLPKAEARLVRVDIKHQGNTIGYIKGAGDDIPVALRNMGYEVTEFKNGEVTAANLAKLDAVVLGVRAFNTNERLRFLMPELLNYVKNGGTLVVQYNTNFDLGSIYSPYPLKISRERVAEEDAEVRILKPDHPALNFPNKISTADFEGWVQERGLYFPDTWDQNFETLLSMNDKGEKPKDGSLLIAKYGEGYYVYTGLSFFRELPEGVPGAYKLFANLVSLGKRPAEQPATSSNSAKKNKKKK